jgi:hypothetical protein
MEPGSEDQYSIDSLKSAFLRTSRSGRVSTTKFIAFCELGIGLQVCSPIDRGRIAELIVSLASMVPADDPNKSAVRGISDLAAFLEIPDVHVDISDGLSVSQKWKRLESLVQDAS